MLPLSPVAFFSRPPFAFVPPTSLSVACCQRHCTVFVPFAFARFHALSQCRRRFVHKVLQRFPHTSELFPHTTVTNRQLAKVGHTLVVLVDSVYEPLCAYAIVWQNWTLESRCYLLLTFGDSRINLLVVVFHKGSTSPDFATICCKALFSVAYVHFVIRLRQFCILSSSICCAISSSDRAFGRSCLFANLQKNGSRVVAREKLAYGVRCMCSCAPLHEDRLPLYSRLVNDLQAGTILLWISSKLTQRAMAELTSRSAIFTSSIRATSAESITRIAPCTYHRTY